MIADAPAPAGPGGDGVDLGCRAGLALPGGSDGLDSAAGPGFGRPPRPVVEPAPARADGPDEADCRGAGPAAAGVLPAALACAGVVVHGTRRLRLFPLKARSKEPAVCGWQGKATSSPRKLRPLLAKFPGCNLGLATGRGLLALDIDPRHGGEGSLAALLAEHGKSGLPTTAAALTGSGGRHYLFRVGPGFEVRNKAWRPGLDIKGDGGYVVVEPSVHPTTGREYVWLRHPAHTPIAPLPFWLAGPLLAEGILVPPSELKGQWAREAKWQRARRKQAARPAGSDGRREPEEGKAVPRPSGRPVMTATPTVRPRVGPGDAGWLTADLIARYPITGFGQRRRRMLQAVASVLGRGHDDETALAAVMAWWGHYAENTRATRAEMEADARKCVRSTRKRKGFCAGGGGGHSARIASIRLSAAQEAALEPVAVFRTPRRPLGGRCPADPTTGPPRRPRPLSRMSVPPIGEVLCEPPGVGGRFCDEAPPGPPLCQSREEQVFVGVLLRIAASKLADRTAEGDGAAATTHEQIGAVAGLAYGCPLSAKQIDRLKSKYFFRLGPPGKPDREATRVELLREIKKGRRAVAGRDRGEPSVYAVSDALRALIDLGDGPGAAARLATAIVLAA